MGWRLAMEIPLNSQLLSLPVTRVAQQGESGMGFLLRNATANGLSLHALRSLAGIASVRTLWTKDAPGLAALMCIPVSELQARLVEKGRFLGEPAYLLQGQVFLRTELLRVSKPQVCVLCVHRLGYCKAQWDCRLYTVCHIHKIPMTESCRGCGKALRWFRPAIDVCHCGSYLRALHDQAVAEDCDELMVATWIANHFEHGANDLWTAGGYPDWIGALSLDGFCTLIRAFGSHTVAHQRVVNSGSAKESGTFWQEVCARALQRLRAYEASVNVKELAPWIWAGGLESLALASVSGADQQVARKLLREIFGIVATTKFGSQRSALCQLSLFED